MLVLFVIAMAVIPNCFAEFLYEQYPSHWDTEEFAPFDDIVTSEYERQIHLSKKSEPIRNLNRTTDNPNQLSSNDSLAHDMIQQAFLGSNADSPGHLLDLDLDHELEQMRDSSFYDALDYLEYGSVEIFERNNDSSLKAMLAQLIHNSSCTQVGENLSVMCCTFSMDNTSTLSTICSNETKEAAHDVGSQLQQRLYHRHHVPATFCPPNSWKPLLNLICVPTLCVFGLCGNTISFLVMCSSAYRRKSYGHYLRALAVFDNLTLIINLVFTLNDVLYSVADSHNGTYTGFMSYHSSASCKVTEFMRHVVYLMSSWLVVCFTVDRFIAVCFPLLRVRYCTERCAIYTTVILLVAIMLSQTYHLVFVERLERERNAHLPCHAPNNVRLTYFGLNYFLFSFLLRFTLPFIAIAMCNGCIIYHIARMRKGRRAKETRRKQKASLAIYTLYAVCACFVITVLPNAILSIIQFSAFFLNERRLDPNLYCTLSTLYTPFHILRLVNYSANCVLYGVAGRQFRQELYKLLWCCMGRHALDKRSIQSPEPIALKADLLLTSRKNGNTVIRIK